VNRVQIKQQSGDPSNFILQQTLAKASAYKTYGQYDIIKKQDLNSKQGLGYFYYSNNEAKIIFKLNLELSQSKGLKFKKPNKENPIRIVLLPSNSILISFNVSLNGY